MIDVSIIIPVYNSASFIIDTLISIQNQAYKDFECILIDDGSQDNSVELMKDFAVSDARFHVFERPEHHKSGGRGAKNYGYTKSKGEFICFFDSDDIMMDDFLQKKVEVLKSDPKLDFVASNYYWKVRRGRLLRKFSYKIDFKRFDSDFWCHYLNMDFYMPPPAPLWRRSFFERKKLWDEETHVGDDYEFHARMFLDKPTFRFIDDYLWYYVDNNSSIMHTKDLYSVSSSALSRIKVVEELFDRNVISDELLKIEFRWQCKIIRQLIDVFHKKPSFRLLFRLFKYLPKHLKYVSTIRKMASFGVFVQVRLIFYIILYLVSTKGMTLFEFIDLGIIKRRYKFEIINTSTYPSY